jgi:hypothetical protein
LQERTPQCLDAADVRLRRTGADRKTDYRARHIGRAIANDRAECDQIVKFRPRQNRNIKDRTVLDRTFQGNVELEFDIGRHVMRASEQRHQFAQRFHGVKAEIDASARLYQCAGAMPCWSRRPPDRLRALRRNCQSDRPCRISDSGTAKAGVITVG